jgi:hypothetical protein
MMQKSTTIFPVKNCYFHYDLPWFLLKKNQIVRLFWQNVAFVVFWIFFWSLLRKIGFLEESNASKIFLRRYQSDFKRKFSKMYDGIF